MAAHTLPRPINPAHASVLDDVVFDLADHSERRLSPVEQEVFDLAIDSLATPLTARECWFVEIAECMANAGRTLGWDGKTVEQQPAVAGVVAAA